MSLQNRAILEIDGGSDVYEGEAAVFEFRDIDSSREEIEPDHLIGGSGQVLSELYDQLSERDPTDLIPDRADLDRRAGYYVDGGAGRDSWTLSFEAGLDEADRWGDGSSDVSDPTDVTRTDAQGSRPSAKRDVLLQWIAQNRVDSSGQARLYVSEWADGTHADEPGAFGEPIPVAILSASAEVSTETTLEGTLEVVRVSVFPDLTGAAEDLVDELGDLIPDP